METNRLTLVLLFSVVLDLIYWRDVKKSGVVFGSMMLMLLSLAMFSRAQCGRIPRACGSHRHRQLQGLQEHPRSRAEIKRGPSVQVST